MIRVHIICEGQTEEMFVNEILNPWFYPSNIRLYPALLGKPGHKGGNVRFERLRIDLQNRLLRDRNAYCTTFLDYYGLPQDFPGKRDATINHTIEARALSVYNALVENMRKYVGDEPLRRFVPYVQMYEFEALILSEPSFFEKWFDAKSSLSLQNERQQFPTPEHINDNPLTAPSKRIQNHCSGYEKPLHGSLIAMEIGLETIRRECPLFRQWLDILSTLAPLDRFS